MAEDGILVGAACGWPPSSVPASSRFLRRRQAFVCQCFLSLVARQGLCRSASGSVTVANQTQRDTLLFEELSGEVTITDPTHPLYGQTFPCLSIRVNRSKTHVTVLLPTGRRRSVPRLATNLERPAEESSSDPPLPVISVRTILPLAHLVQGLKQAKEEGHAEQAASTIQPTEQCSTSSDDDLSSASYEQPTATRSPGRRTHSARPQSRKRQGV